MNHDARWLPPALTVEEFSVHSPIYPAALALREKVLRIPLGRHLDAADIADEERQFHFGAFTEEAMVGCVVLKPLAGGTQAKLRQMAVADSARGLGVGRALVLAAEAAAREKGIRLFELSARHAAVGFYEKLGYRTQGALYQELNIPHVKMIKTIA